MLTLWRHRASITNNTWSTHDIECTGSHVTCIAYTSLSDVITCGTGSELCTIRICSTRIVQVYFLTISWVIFIVFVSKIEFIDNWKVTGGTLTSCTDDVTRAVSRDGNAVGVVWTGIKQATPKMKCCLYFSNSVDLYKSKLVLWLASRATSRLACMVGSHKPFPTRETLRADICVIIMRPSSRLTDTQLHTYHF